MGRSNRWMPFALTGVLGVAMCGSGSTGAMAQATFCLSITGTPDPFCTQNPQDYDYSTSRAVTPSVPEDEFIIKRQQELLRRSISQGKANQQAGQDNLSRVLPNINNSANQNIAQYCEGTAFPAYEASATTYQQAASQYDTAAQQFSQAQGAFGSASATPYIYNQLAAQNAAWQSYATAQQQFVQANQQMASASEQFSRASKEALNCQVYLSQAQQRLNYNNAGATSQLVTAVGQFQEGSAAQKQWETDSAAQNGRAVFGIQRGVSQAMGGLIKTGPSLNGSPRPKRY